MITTRPIESKDFKPLAEVYTDAYNSLNIGEKWTPVTAEVLLKHLHDSQPDLFFVATEENKVIGAANAIVKPWWDGNHITDGEIFIDPAFQGKGVGKILLKKLFEEAKEKYSAVSWDTFTHRVYEHPLKWYKSLGFKEIEQWVMITGDINTVLENLKT